MTDVDRHLSPARPLASEPLDSLSENTGPAREGSQPVEQTARAYETTGNGGVRPPGGPSTDESSAWASRLLGWEATVLESSPRCVTAQLKGVVEPIVSGIDFDSCGCQQFRLSGRCRHVRALVRMRKALRAREEELIRHESAALAAAWSGATVDAGGYPLGRERPPEAPVEGRHD